MAGGLSLSPLTGPADSVRRSLGAASRPTPVPQPTGLGDELRLRTLLRDLAAQAGAEVSGGPSMSELEWQPQSRRNPPLGLPGADPAVGVWGQNPATAPSASRVDPATAAPSRPLTLEELATLPRRLTAGELAALARARRA